MTNDEIAAIRRSAEHELNANEDAMLIHPLALLGLIERLERCETQRAEAGEYSVLHDA